MSGGEKEKRKSERADELLRYKLGSDAKKNESKRTDLGTKDQ